MSNSLKNEEKAFERWFFRNYNKEQKLYKRDYAQNPQEYRERLKNRLRKELGKRDKRIFILLQKVVKRDISKDTT